MSLSVAFSELRLDEHCKKVLKNLSVSKLQKSNFLNLKMKFLSLVSFLLCIFKIQISESANILFYHVLSSYSHRIAVWPLVEALAARGHNVTFFHIFEPKHPNPAVHEFFPKSLETIWDHPSDDDGNMTSENEYLKLRVKYGPSSISWDCVYFAMMGADFCETTLADPEVEEFVKTSKFDLVVIDALFNDCAYGLAHKWGAKTIVYFTALPTGIWGTETAGFLGTTEPWISDLMIPFEMPMSFIDRVQNMFITVSIHLIKEWIYYPGVDAVLKKRLNDPNLPPVRDMQEKTALVFYNGHFSEEEARSLPPKFVAVPALHVWDYKPEKLPQSISTFIEDSGENGFIYVSFGGEASIHNAPIEFQNIFVQVFSEMNIRVLWKRKPTEGVIMPKNVFPQDWMPQKDILSSPKCRGFISHGGLLGLQEAIMNAVPMIIMPVFAEQEYNANRLQRNGRGIKLEPYGLTREKLKSAIEQLLSNNSYRQQMEKVRNQLRDQINTPLETAVFWTEYALRHDMSTLQPAKIRDFYWFQAQYLDVWAFFAFVITNTTVALVYVMKKIFKFFTAVSRNPLRISQKIKTS